MGTNHFQGDQYIGDAIIYDSDVSTFPRQFKTEAGSFNFKAPINDDITFKTSGSGMVTLEGGWGLGFKATPRFGLLDPILGCQLLVCHTEHQLNL